MKKSFDELVYALSCECKEAVYSNIEHREFLNQMAKKLEALARQIQMEQSIAMHSSPILNGDMANEFNDTHY